MSPQLNKTVNSKKITWPKHVNKVKLNKNVSLFAPNISTVQEEKLIRQNCLNTRKVRKTLKEKHDKRRKSTIYYLWAYRFDNVTIKM